MKNIRFFGLCFLLWCITSTIAHAQNRDKFIDESKFVDDLKTLFSRETPAAQTVVNNAAAVLQSLSPEQKTGVFKIIGNAYAANMPAVPYIESILLCFATAKTKQADKFDSFLKVATQTLQDFGLYKKKDGALKYFSAMNDFFGEGFIYKGKFNQYQIKKSTSYQISYAKPQSVREAEEKAKLDSIDAAKKYAADTASQAPTNEETGWDMVEEEKKNESNPADNMDGKVVTDLSGWGDDPWGDTASSTDTTKGGSTALEPIPAEIPQECVTPVNDSLALEGTLIQFETTDLAILTSYDSVQIKGVKGTVAILAGILNAQGGSFSWEKLGLKDAFCQLSSYSINFAVPFIEDKEAVFSYKSKTDSLVKGIFTYKALKTNKNPVTAEYPNFMSYKANIPVKNIVKDMNYNGGFSLIGKRFSSRNYCGETSNIEIYKGGKLKFKATSRYDYLFTDSMLFNPNASVVVYMTDTSTISHPGVRLRYMLGSGDLTARKEKREYRNTPFFDSYHKVEIMADNLKWNVSADTMQLSILNAKQQVPAEIRSVDFYNEIEMKELQRLQRFHPLLILNGYLTRKPKNNQDKSLLDQERATMSMYLKNVSDQMKISLNSLYGIMLDLHRLGLVEYDSKKYTEVTEDKGKSFKRYYGWVKLLRKGKLFIDAHNKRSDYDKVWLKSFMPNGRNMKLDLKSNEMTVSGVPFFYLKKVDGDQREERTEMVEQRVAKLAQDSIKTLPQAQQDSLSDASLENIKEAFRQIERKRIDLMDVSVWDTLKPQTAEQLVGPPPTEIKVEKIVENPFLTKKELKEKEKKDKEAAEKAMADWEKKKKAKEEELAKNAEKYKDVRKLKSKQVIIKENREMEFNAHPLVAEDYARFYGKSFTFNYKDYFVRMPATDSLMFEGADNGIKVTSGTFYLGHPNNKSSYKSYPEYPKFEAEVGGFIDFKSNKILDGAYDSLVKFELEPFTLDSMASSNPENENLMGMFESNGIFPDFRDTIKLGKFQDVSEDPKHAKKSKSFGLVHYRKEFAPEYTKGYPMYRKTNAFFDGDIKLEGNNGIRGNGHIRYLTADLYSNDFIFYEDSVVTFGKKSAQNVVSNGTIADTTFTYAGEKINEPTTYPDVKMSWFGMQWRFQRDKIDDTKILQDSMLLISQPKLPFDMYYKHYDEGQRGKFQGTLVLSDKGLRGHGQFDNLNSMAKSDEFKFNNDSYNSRHTFFAIKKVGLDSGAVAGKNKFSNAVEATNVKVDYMFEKAIEDEEPSGHAVIETETKGQQSFAFPDARYKTSLGKADWFFAYRSMTMSMPEGSDLSSSVFSSTHLPEGQNVSFNGSNAIYNLSQYELTVSGVPYIYSMHARVIPLGNVVIEKGAKMQPLENAMVELLANKDENDTVVHHTLYNSSIVVHSRNKFTGSGFHKYKNDAGREYDIKFDNFIAKGRASEDDTTKIVYAETKLTEKDDFMKQAGVQFRGKVILRADSVNLLFEGEIKFVDEPNSAWFPLKNSGGAIEVAGVEEVDGKEFGTGVFISNEKQLKTIFKSELEKGDKPIFKSNGVFRKDIETGELVIEPLERQRPPEEQYRYIGNNFIYNSKMHKAHFDGEFDLIKPENDFKFRVTGVGNSDFQKRQYNINAMVVLNIPELKGNAFKKMGEDIAKYIKNTEPKHLPVNNDSMFYKASHFMPAKELADFIKDARKGKLEYSDYLGSSLVLNNVNLQWSEKYKAFYSKGKIGLANVFKEEANIWVDGYVEIPFSPNPKDQVINIYLELSKNKWYFITQRGNDLKVLASSVPPSEGTNDFGNPEFNNDVGDKKSKDKFLKPADATEKAKFRSHFRQAFLNDNSAEPEENKEEDKTIEDDGN